MKKIVFVNFITFLRIIGAIVLIFLKPFQLAFFIVYLSCGLTDFFDGFFARKLKATSNFGEKFDSLTDLVFFVICSFIVVVNFNLKIWVLFVIFIVCLLRLFVSLIKYFLTKKILLEHSFLNKIAGFICFFSLLFVNLIDTNVLLAIDCFFPLLSVLQEIFNFFIKKA